MVNNIRELLDEIKPHVQKGGKYEQFHTSFDALETFLFKPDHTTDGSKGVHIKDGIDLKRTMFTVVIAMIPALLFGIFNVGHQYYAAIGEYTGLTEGFVDKIIFGLIKVLPIVIVAYAAGLAVEFLMATIKGHQVNEGFLVSGMLIALIMPPDIPLWMLAVATIFAVIFGKEVFGGTGMNFLNVALTARVFIFFAYPSDISGDTVWIANQPDGFAGATPLAISAQAGYEELSASAFSFSSMFWGTIPGSIGETSIIPIALGALILAFTGIGSWRIMLTVLLGGVVMGALLNVLDVVANFDNPFLSVPAHYHLVMGSLAFGAVFMATDPVTASHTEKGKYIYGFLIGVFAVIIRVLNPAYPEGVMLAILFFNVFAPLIDHYVIQANIQKRLSRVKK